ncbi:FkbM family methyltransferase [Sinorhizobium medicae]|uniref:FkbM family methyltransferase n=1 Tax=Sinorhizobium medicae TaxID=110321 RepID=UPI001AAE52D0|nr:FkbM family methyltransferase [Sinorhizobium medicae]MBO1962967.1 FkbM family methyltransferase [Sinorhizobium medicae]WQP39313.1 FkbM family methyltransferase [Sinorhizobium medicae]
MRLFTGETRAIDHIRTVNDWHICMHWGQSGEDAVLYRILGEKRGGFYVDIGAHHPRRFSNTHLFHKHLGWSGINVDANDDTIAMFKKERPKDVNIVALIGEGTRKATYTEFKGNARSTADADRTDRLKKGGFEIVSQKEMTPRTLKSILDEHLKAGQKIDLLTIDIEGLDLQALRTNDWAKYRPEVVCVEDFDFRKGKDSEVARFMSSVDYVCTSHCYDTSIYQKS